MAKPHTLYKSRIEFDDGDYGVMLLYGILGMGLFLVAVLGLQHLLTSAKPLNWFVAVLASLMLTSAIIRMLFFRRKVAFHLTDRSLLMRFPHAAFKRRRVFPLQLVRQVRFGVTRKGYWCVVYSHPKPGQPDAHEFEVDATEAAVVGLVQELEGMGIEAVVFDEL